MSGENDSFERLIHGLERPSAYPHDVSDIRRLETHISYVLLTGPFAYKIKKPVDFGFIDCSTLEKRRRFCEEELRLNSRLAPTIYQQVVPITGTPDEPQIGGPSEPLEYAVKMVEFSQDQLLSRLAEQGEITPEFIDRLADIVAEFHTQIPSDKTESHSTTDDIRHFANANLETLRASQAPFEQPEYVADLAEWTAAEFSARRPDFEQRRRGGFIRECHGDMHLGNMIDDNGTPVIFDCIEFNEHLRWIDIISEVAFTVMDLEDRGYPEFAWRFLNRWLEKTGDYRSLTTLPFYLVYRALVRAKVATLRLDQHPTTPAEDTALREERDGYIDQAHRYAHPQSPELFITHGLSGSGKTFGTQHFIERHPAIRIRSDIERKRLLGVAAEENATHATTSIPAYSSQATEQTYDCLLTAATFILKAGFSVVVDATFLKRRQRDAFRDRALELKVPFHILDFEAPIETLRDRIRRRRQVGRDASDADLDVLELQLQSREPLDADERPDVIAVATDPRFASHS